MKPVVGADGRNMFGQVPFTRLLGARREYSEAGRARLVIDARPELGNVIGAMHGGVLVTLLDVAMASAAVSLFDFDRTAVTLNLNTSFLEPGRGRLTADGEVVQHDSNVAWCHASITDADGRVVARAQGSFRYLPLPQAA
ncbi:PaaI family thioesterase [Variovorax sp. J22G21]|uniref:PaaI family thioesterase n=1 Tax=Variovorax fucosicus TaxID=3053517 RepID=UPI002574E1AB|nr:MULTISPECIES: PaaI family thioesterase [unclassified Variovorax]MDM0039181.1 PaaI family thioesterase [Variovorax sp. J22R193]MDM0055215.1 PaaI family thioesterase [Variovorax sp. J22G47]MDM0063957.1 PaaI family thioesterase [Variovorax sp. J22G21]